MTHNCMAMKMINPKISDCMIELQAVRSPPKAVVKPGEFGVRNLTEHYKKHGKTLRL